MLRVKSLLEAIGFSVEVFEDPVEARPEDEVRLRISAADCFVALLGPREPNQGPRAGVGDSVVVAEYPLAEANLAGAHSKPTVLILDKGVAPPPLLGYQTWPSISFWDPEDYAAKVHLLVRRLLELKETVELPPGSQSQGYEFKRAEIIKKITPGGELRTIAIHEVIAREPCGRFYHQLDTSGDETLEGGLGEVTCSSIQQYTGDEKDLSIEVKKANPFSFEYFVVSSPKLRPGETIGYKRTLVSKNYYPLTLKELRDRRAHGAFPSIFGERQYGDSFHVKHDLRSFSLTYKFPSDTKISEVYAKVVDLRTRDERTAESTLAQECVERLPDLEHDELVVRLHIDKPRISRSYYLIYELGED